MSTLPLNVGPIGPEPAGATPIAEEDLEGLIPDFVATRADRNRVELESITRSLPQLLASARSVGPHAVLDYRFMIDLHRRMFAEVWRWAGTLRRRETNIGVEPRYISQRSMQAIDDARYWHDQHIYPPEDLAARLHAILVDIHPFPNGNGRATRLMAISTSPASDSRSSPGEGRPSTRTAPFDSAISTPSSRHSSPATTGRLSPLLEVANRSRPGSGCLSRTSAEATVPEATVPLEV
jgi:Fic-DOC domain mobile mystery protein B